MKKATYTIERQSIYFVYSKVHKTGIRNTRGTKPFTFVVLANKLFCATMLL